MGPSLTKYDLENGGKAAMSVMPKVITAGFFRRGLADKIRCVEAVPGYVGMVMGQGHESEGFEEDFVPDAHRLVDRAGLVNDIYSNEALSGEVFFIHGGLRLGSKR